jgi:ATP-dependent Zn protease
MNNKSDSLLKNHNSAWKLFNVCHYRFIDQSGFLDLASQGKLSQVIFINNSNFIFGVLKDGSLIRHDYLNNDSLIQIQDSLNKSGTKIFNIENDAATINIVLFVISLLLITILMISFIFACISVAKINSLEKKLKEISNHKIDLNLNKNYALIRDQVSSLSQKVSELEASK